MNASRMRGELAAIFATAVSMTVLLTTAGKSESMRPGSRNLLLWDTVSPVVDKLSADDRASWTIVPDDLLLLEKDPPKASSDPGYYGRDYAFKGDAVVETPTLVAHFCAARGCVRLYSKRDSTNNEQPTSAADWSSSKILELSPTQSAGTSGTGSRIEVLRNGDDEIVLEISLAAGSPGVVGRFSFDKTGIIEVRPITSMNKVQLSGLLQYGVVPAFIGDDLIFDAERCRTNTVAIPSENLLVGLLSGETAELVMTWPKGQQQVSLRFEQQPEESSMRFDDDGRVFYLAVLSAPGIWHKEALTPDYLEKDVKIKWKRPFPAKWKTQLTEEDLKTTFAFRESKGEIWRGVAGSYVYPVWFEGDEAYYRLSKKVAPEGESVIYCLEGRDTPSTLSTPVDILKQTLGRQASESILDLPGRKLRTHHRRAGLGVRRACTCGCTEAIQAVFEAGDELNQKDCIQGALDDMIYFVHCHVQRINEYRQFADGVLKLIGEKRQGSAELKPFLDSVEEIAQRIPHEYEVQKENMKDFAYADELSGKTMALTNKQDPDNLKTYMELLKAWRAMGGAQDYVLAKCHMITRDLAQAAGYNAATIPGALPLAEEIRARCRQTLRNPDGYEIWADY